MGGGITRFWKDWCRAPGNIYAMGRECAAPMCASLGATGTPAVNRAGNPPRTTDTRVKPAFINCSATRALVASSGQSQ